jgi:hypothetical protein
MIEAAYRIAMLERANGEPTARKWLRETVDAWEAYRAKAPVTNGRSAAQSPPYVDYAAEAELTLLDEQITEQYDNSDRHRYEPYLTDIFGEIEVDPKTHRPVVRPDGNVKIRITGKYQLNATEANKWDGELDKLVKKYESVEWVPTIIARQASLFDRLRTGLYNTYNVQLNTPKEKALLTLMQNSGRDDLIDKADLIQDAKRDYWRSKKQQELDGADTVTIRRYATAVAVARRYNIRNPHLVRAVNRLGYYTDIISDAKMAEHVRATPDPVQRGSKLTYSPFQFVLARPGLAALPPPSGRAPPLPIPP